MSNSPNISRPAARKFPSASLALSALALGIFLTPQGLHWCVLGRDSMAQGQWWRLLTCHWVHWTGEHLLWDVTTFFFLAAWIERRSRRLLLKILGLSMPGISLAVLAVQPGLQFYGGLSGLCVALFAALAYHSLTPSKEFSRPRPLARVAVLLLLGFAGKCLFEAITGQTLFVNSSGAFVPVPIAHLAGAACGWIVAWGETKFGHKRILCQLVKEAVGPNLTQIPAYRPSRDSALASGGSPSSYRIPNPSMQFHVCHTRQSRVGFPTGSLFR